jgi:hypothetical protein
MPGTHRFAHSNFVNVETFTSWRPPVHSTPFHKPQWVDLSITAEIPDPHDVAEAERVAAESAQRVQEQEAEAVRRAESAENSDVEKTREGKKE